MQISNNQQTLLILLRAGLWENDCQVAIINPIEYSAIYHMAEEQAIVGLITSGFEHIKDTIVPPKDILSFIGCTLRFEQRNLAMTSFISKTIVAMRKEGIYSLLVKGQGLAQCYEKPLWRTPGDIDFLFDEENYRKSISYMSPLSSGKKPEGRYSKHLGLNVDHWYVELHGSLRTGLSTRIDRVIDAVYTDTFENNNIRIWKSDDTVVPLPSPDNDVFFVFTHYIKHFYKEGMCIRQLCDWSRLLWTYRDTIDSRLLEIRIRKAGLMEEWRAFSSVVVDYLGMPTAAMPLYENKKKWHRKANMLICIILGGNYKTRLLSATNAAKVFPIKTIRYLPSIFLEINLLKLVERFSIK